MARRGEANDSQIIIEYRANGRFVKVSAIDSLTNEEVSIIGDARHPKEYLASQAVKKLRFMQQKR